MKTQLPFKMAVEIFISCRSV